jgi:hypothetical protein
MPPGTIAEINGVWFLIVLLAEDFVHVGRGRGELSTLKDVYVGTAE